MRLCIATIISSMTMQKTSITKSAQERAYLYDLYIVPTWREVFDQLVDEKVKIPTEGKFLDASCGTGGYAVDLASRIEAKGDVVGIDNSLENIALAQAKADVKKIDNLKFEFGELESLKYADKTFDFIVADLSLIPPDELASRVELIFNELARVANTDATIVIKLATRGSFDEFYSVYWEALYSLDLEDYTPQLEELISERLTIEQVEELARAAGLKRVSSITHKHRFDFENAEAFLNSPLIETEFLDRWLSILDNERDSSRVKSELVEVIDQAREHMDFDVSIKATLIIGHK